MFIIFDEYASGRRRKKFVLRSEKCLVLDHRVDAIDCLRAEG
jgi:hypothetical protein